MAATHGIGVSAITASIATVAGAIGIWGFLIGPVQRLAESLRDDLHRLEEANVADLKQITSMHVADVKVISKEINDAVNDGVRFRTQISADLSKLRTDHEVLAERVARCEKNHSSKE